MKDYKCDNKDCDFRDEYGTAPSLPKSMQPPEECPKCKKGKMVQVFDVGFKNLGCDVIGGYEYEYGKKSTKGMSDMDKQTY